MEKPVVEKKPWMDSVTMSLATTADLDRIVEECIEAGVYGLDLETTGLDARVFYSDDGSPYTNDKIVGYCISPNPDTGYYIPVRHKETEANVPPRLVAEAVKRLVESDAVAVFHNGKFDQEFLQHDDYGPIGEWDNPKKWEDTFILAYLRNTRERNKGLKALSKNELGMEMIELKELFPVEKRRKGFLDFSTLDPEWEPTVWYAAADAICTLRLFHILHPTVLNKDDHQRSQSTIYALEKGCVTATRWMERCRIHVDRDKIEELIRIGQAEWMECLKEVYRDGSELLGRDIRPGWFRVMLEGDGSETAFDPTTIRPNYMEVRERATQVPFETPPPISKSVPSLTNPKLQESVTFPAIYDVTIPANLGLMMRELKVQGLRPTEKSGQVKTSKDELERVIDNAGDQFPFMAKVKRFREVAKGLSSNLFPVWLDTSTQRAPDGCIWVGFNAHKVDTGRFSTPAPNKKSFNGQVRWNLHSIPATYDKSKPSCLLRMRECLTARPGRILFAIDYSGVELRIVTNISGEPKWITEFFRCSSCDRKFEKGQRPPPFCPDCGSDKIGDLHTLTALSIYGDDSRSGSGFKQKRQNAKALNFAMCYGGGGMAAQRAVGVDKEEGHRIKRQFDKTYTGLRQWWRLQHKTAKKQKYVTTAFGRKYPLPDIDHEMGGFRAKAERNSVNGPVQGTSADIMKLAMALLYREIKKRGWLKKVLMTVTIHDELVFEIEEAVAEEAVILIEDVMVNKTSCNLPWLIPLKVDIEFGGNWTVPNNLTEMENNQGGGNWTPRLVSVFPTKYATYLEKGGTPVDGEAPAPQPTAVQSDPKPEVVNGKGKTLPQDISENGGGEVHVYRVPSHKLTLTTAERLARVIDSCAGRGTDTLRIETDGGIDLLNEEVRVSFIEFQIVARHEGL